ncbi:hypothetical protein GDO86_016387 [Hymenochirus boettgeri]|uniref:Fibrous sheath-interacting protein 1 n=1 Tax=Hymenochirus boettgeri TaxID=247094 RepID=A0A8T2K133_9PIPI|nr:hypothetical protein GDO86_016387 [Hymenochirus boettgeri]
MDIMKGNLDEISRPAHVSRSRPGSRISSSVTTEKPKRSSTACSLEVLSPEPGFLEIPSEQCLERETSLDVKSWTPTENRKTQIQLGQLARSHAEENEGCNRNGPGLETDDQQPFPLRGTTVSDESEDELSDPASPECEDRNQSDGESQTEDNGLDGNLDKAIKKMQALDEILQKKMAKEKKVKAQGLEIRKQLWEELQRVTAQSSARSYEENMNTNKFLALTPQLHEAEDNSNFDIGSIFTPVFSTQLPTEDPVEDENQETVKGHTSGSETSDRSYQKSKQRKGQKKGVDFIQRNIELAKDAGSFVLLMDDEKLRLERLLEDISDGSSDEEVMGDESGWIVQGEGYTPETNESNQLAKIEAELQVFRCRKDSLETINCELKISIKAFEEALQEKNENSGCAPGEGVLRYTKELRDQKLRLKEIDQQLEDMETNSSNAISVISRYNSSSDLS